MIKIVTLPLLCWVAGAHAFGAADCGDKVRSRFDGAKPIEHTSNNTNNQQKLTFFFLVGGLRTSLLNVFTVPREWKTAWTLALIASLVGLLPQIHLTRCATKMVRPAALVVKIAKTRKDRP